MTLELASGGLGVPRVSGAGALRDLDMTQFPLSQLKRSLTQKCSQFRVSRLDIESIEMPH